LRMLLHPANFLLLDEPTNHLDMRAKDVLLEALSKYTGTVLFVSHDRYFIDKLATRIFEVGDGRVEVYPGNYEDYLWRKQGGAAALEQSVVASVKPSSGSAELALPNNGKGHKDVKERIEDNQKRLNPIKRKQIEERVRELEQEISRLETNIEACETALQTFVSASETERLSRELNDGKTQLKSCLAEWEELGQTLQA
jgi:ATP-binding cassette subfamily F protein 3